MDVVETAIEHMKEKPEVGFRWSPLRWPGVRWPPLAFINCIDDEGVANEPLHHQYN